MLTLFICVSVQAASVLYTSTLIDYPSANETIASGIDGSNLAGYYRDSNNRYHGFEHNGTNWTTLDYANASWTFPYGIDGSNSSRRLKKANPKLRTTFVKIYNSEQLAQALENPLADCLWVGFVPSVQEMDRAHRLGKKVWLSLYNGANCPDI